MIVAAASPSRAALLRSASRRSLPRPPSNCRGSCCGFVALPAKGRAFGSIGPASSNDVVADGQPHYDVLIVGGGAVGATLAHCLASNPLLGAMKVGLMESRGAPPPLSSYYNGSGNGIGALPNARAYALSPASLELINKGGNDDGPVEKLDAMGRMAWYDAMQIWESDGPATLNFRAEDLAPDAAIDPYNETKATGDKERGRFSDVLGAVVEDGPLVSALWDSMRSSKNDAASVDLICNASVTSISAPSSLTTGRAVIPHVELTYSHEEGEAAGTQTKACTASLLVAADGANSFVRRTLGMPTVGFGYGRRALTCTVKIDATKGGMGRMAFQRFMPNGPMALLPVWSEQAGSSSSKDGEAPARGGDVYANIVWSTTPSHCDHLKSLSTEEFINEINECMQSGPMNAQPLFSAELKSALPGPFADLANGIDALARGANDGLTMSHWSESPARSFRVPPRINDVVGPRLAFDLNLSQAREYTRPRVALVGDAAHTVHPMAGQGLNLGLGDVECLVKVIQTATEAGMDVGGTNHFLKQYERDRQLEVTAVLGGVQALHAAFGTTFAPAVWVRSLGMNLVNSAGPVRRTLAEVAAGRRGVFTDGC